MRFLKIDKYHFSLRINDHLFHIRNAEHVPFDKLPDRIGDLIQNPANTVVVVMGNDEGVATKAWKILIAESVPNGYILEGGINVWLDTFSGNFENNFCGMKATSGKDELSYNFTAAIGSGCPAAYPDVEDIHVEYIEKITLELKRATFGGGCGLTLPP